MKVNKHKRFNYTPHYYDERKERIQKIRETYNEKEGTPISEKQAQLRERIQSEWHGENSSSRQSRMSNIRLIIILAALLLVVYYILGYVDIFTAEIIDIEK